MAPVNPNNTQRWWFEYFDGVNNHELMLRGDTDATTGDMISVFSDFITALDPVLHEITVIGGRYADQGSNISNPFTYDGAPTSGTGELSEALAPREISYEGRSNDGRIVSYSMFGLLGTTSGNFRYAAGENAALDAARAVLVAAANAGVLVTISGGKPIFKTYINLNYNSYWERQARG